MSEHIRLKTNPIEVNQKKVDILYHFPFFPLDFKRKSLLKIMKDYDPITSTHMTRVAEWTNYLSDVLGVNSQILKIAAEQHDIGKLFVPLWILHPSSNSESSEVEKEHRKRHIIYSAEILARLRFPEDVVRIALFHETPFQDIKRENLYQGKYFLPSILRVADVLVAALENPSKYGNGSIRNVIPELVRQVKEGIIQREVLLEDNPVLHMALVDALNEHSTHLPMSI